MNRCPNTGFDIFHSDKEDVIDDALIDTPALLFQFLGAAYAFNVDILMFYMYKDTSLNCWVRYSSDDKESRPAFLFTNQELTPMALHAEPILKIPVAEPSPLRPVLANITNSGTENVRKRRPSTDLENYLHD